ncbi:MAG: hypothetical protein ABIP63_10860 [Thermoanaerobaculia bacterium]
MRVPSIAAAVILSASVCLANATVEQKTQFHFSGPLGGMINVFSRSAREGVTSNTSINGNRKLTRTGDHGEIVDLDQEKVYMLDFDRQTYTVKTFAEMRREWEEQQERARKSARDRKEKKSEKADKNEGPEYEVEFDIKSTGKKQVVNGWNTHEEVMTVTVHEKGKTLAKGGGFILSSDLWMGPRVPAFRELADFDRRFASKLYGSAFNTDMRQMAMAAAMTPAFGRAMKVMAEHRASFDGTPIRTAMTFVTVAGTDAPKQEETAERESSPGSVSSAVIGGLFNKMKKRNEERKRENNEESTPQPEGRSELFSSTSELLKASSAASAAEVALPAGFRQR